MFIYSKKKDFLLKYIYIKKNSQTFLLCINKDMIMKINIYMININIKWVLIYFKKQKIVYKI